MRQKKSRKKLTAIYLAIILIALVIGYIASQNLLEAIINSSITKVTP